MGFKYVYQLLKNQAAIVRTCSSENEPVAVEYESAVKVLKRYARQNNKENPGTANNSVRKAIANRPAIVCLCGSTRFSEAFRNANLCETLAGKIVLSIGCDFKSDQGLGLTEADKDKLDILHLRKIDLADEVLILNVGGYIGKSTRKELDYALTNNKRVRYLEALQLP